jgi:hypothetical protein
MGQLFFYMFRQHIAYHLQGARVVPCWSHELKLYTFHYWWCGSISCICVCVVWVQGVDWLGSWTPSPTHIWNTTHCLQSEAAYVAYVSYIHIKYQSNTSYILILLKLGYMFQLFRVIIRPSIGTNPRTYKVIVHSGIPCAYKDGIMYSTGIYFCRLCIFLKIVTKIR